MSKGKKKDKKTNTSLSGNVPFFLERSFGLKTKKKIYNYIILINDIDQRGKC